MIGLGLYQIGVDLKARLRVLMVLQITLFLITWIRCVL